MDSTRSNLKKWAVAGGILLSAAALALPLQIDGDVSPSLLEAATMAGFEPGRCDQGPCAHWGDDGLLVRMPDGATSTVPVVAGAEATALAVARSRLALAALLPAAEPEVGRVAPRSVPAVVPPRRVQVAPQQLEPLRGPAVAVLRDPAPAPVRRVALARSPSRGPRPWMAGAAGQGTSSVFLVQAGVEGRRGWWGLGGRMDGGAFTADVGVGVARTRGPVGVRLGAWVGVEGRVEDCTLCQVDVQDTPRGERVVTSGMFDVQGSTPGLGAVARAELEASTRLAGAVQLAPRVGIAGSPRGVWPEAVVALRLGR